MNIGIYTVNLIEGCIDFVVNEHRYRYCNLSDDIKDCIFILMIIIKDYDCLDQVELLHMF